MQRVNRCRHTDFKAQAVALTEPLGLVRATRQSDMSAKTLAKCLGVPHANQLERF